MNTTETAFVLRQRLIDSLREKGYIRSPRVEAAFRAVPRHLFVPDVNLESVYCDVAFVTKQVEGIPVSSSSEPGIMGIMLKQLDLQQGHRVLEIGAGTGYNAALMAHIVGGGGRVITVDIDEDLVEKARHHLAEAGVDHVEVVCRDGGFGFPDAGPYDRIILTVASTEVLSHWVKQLKSNGKMVLPLAIKTSQKSVAFEKGPGYLVSTSVADCGFMRLRGTFAEPLNVLQLQSEPGLHLILNDQIQLKKEEVCKWLNASGRDKPTGVLATPQEVWTGLNFSLALQEPDLCTLWVTGRVLDSGSTPGLLPLRGKYEWNFANALINRTTLCVLMFQAQPSHNDPTSELILRSFGEEQEQLVRRLTSHVQAWETAGRPTTSGLRIRAYPHDADYGPRRDEIVVKKRETLFIFDWRTLV